MKTICKNCRWWKTYIRQNKFCLCELLSSGMQELYTSKNDSCKGWQGKKLNQFKEFKKSIKLKTSMG
jgi:hypothetical protein